MRLARGQRLPSSALDRLRFFPGAALINQALALYELLGAHADLDLATPTTRWIPRRSIVPRRKARLSSVKRLLARRGSAASGLHVASPAFGCSPSISPSLRSSCSSTFARMDAKTMVSGGSPVGGLRLTWTARWTELERTVGPTIARPRLHAAGQPVSATLRASDAEPPKHRVSWIMPDARHPQRCGDLERHA